MEQMDNTYFQPNNKTTGKVQFPASTDYTYLTATRSTCSQLDLVICQRRMVVLIRYLGLPVPATGMREERWGWKGGLEKLPFRTGSNYHEQVHRCKYLKLDGKGIQRKGDM